jgi:DNA-binding response OmpR family regulator
VRILLIDDDAAFTTMMAEYLASEGFSCERAHDPFDGLERALSGRFDAAVLDVMMPQLDGMELLRRLRRESALPVVMLTAKGDGVDRVLGLELGADDYLPKPVFARELVARLRAVMRRVQSEPLKAVGKSELSIGPLRVAQSRRECWLHGQHLPLTSTEFDLIALFAKQPGDVLSKDELSERALRRPREPYDRSVDVHVSNLRQKLGGAGGGVEIETVRAVGYRLKVPE